MKHLRKDWDGIQDTRRGFVETYPNMPKSSIEIDEPVFLLRAKDPAAAATVFYWAKVAEEQGADPELVARVIQWSTEMTIWRQENYPSPKVADTPKELLR